jgi:hypothetical protein
MSAQRQFGRRGAQDHEQYIAIEKLILPSAESAPAATSTGIEGKGSPSCSARTQTKSNSGPFVNKISVGNAIV